MVHCGLVDCDDSDDDNIITTVDWSGQVGEHSVNVPSIDGLPIIIYYDDTSGALKSLRCAYVGCAIP